MFELAAVQQTHIPVAHLVPPVDLARDWDAHARIYERALEKSWQASDTLDHVTQALARGQAWAVDIDLGDKILASAVVEKIETKEGTMLNIWLCAGEAMNEWLPEILEFIENWAVVLDAQGVMLSGRHGWARALKKYGYEITHITMKKGLDYEYRRQQ